MQNYREFLDLSVGFPQEGFSVVDDELFFHDIPLMEVIETYGTPLRFTYMPLISKKIKQAKKLFNDAMKKKGYGGTYTYCYCTKSSHFRHVVEEGLKNDIHLETSSAFDMPIIEYLEKKGHLDKDVTVICNGYKTEEYKEYMTDLIHDGFKNIIPVLDNKEELNYYQNELEVNCNLGIRVATEERPDFEFYTSRLGIRSDEILDFYKAKLKRNKKFKVVMLHFFVDSGIRDTPHYWTELEKAVHTYCKFAKVNPHLTTIDIGGGMPFKNSLAFDFDYTYMVEEIIGRIKDICDEQNVKHPNIITEFGSFTVAESSGILFKVLGRKQQNDREKWLMIDGSLITMLPDAWAINQRYILLPINNWDEEYEKVSVGGITCDTMDYYNNEAHVNAVYMPKTRKAQYIGFFHTGAYQESLSGLGGIHHCLIPTPKQLLISRNPDGTFWYDVLHEEQNSKQVLKLLGYK
jgi:arginine decarboxylase